jgi:uncharacterized lipoprotein YajG
MSTPSNVATMVRLLSTRPCRPPQVSLWRPLVALVLLAACAVAPFALTFLVPQHMAPDTYNTWTPE